MEHFSCTALTKERVQMTEEVLTGQTVQIRTEWATLPTGQEQIAALAQAMLQLVEARLIHVAQQAMTTEKDQTA
jgi:hypothetical protein